MSNPYFQFKRFRIAQDKCAMKVSTDACIQGAWTPIDKQVQTVLDIGTGTGLLSLMLLQRKQDIKIDAIELDLPASEQAKENISQSPWKNNIHIINTDARDYTADKKYDLIITNPPFFQNSLLGSGPQRNKARHTDSLSYSDLFHCIEKNLSANGYASVMLPFAEHAHWEELLQQNNWTIFQRLNVYPREQEKPIRIISLCSPVVRLAVPDEKLVVREAGDDYTSSFTALLQQYYLYL